MPGGGGNVRGEKDRVGKDQGGKDLESSRLAYFDLRDFVC